MMMVSSCLRNREETSLGDNDTNISTALSSTELAVGGGGCICLYMDYI